MFALFGSLPRILLILTGIDVLPPTPSDFALPWPYDTLHYGRIDSICPPVSGRYFTFHQPCGSLVPSTASHALLLYLDHD
jgi:hypothetical protein